MTGNRTFWSYHIEEISITLTSGCLCVCTNSLIDKVLPLKPCRKLLKYWHHLEPSLSSFFFTPSPFSLFRHTLKWVIFRKTDFSVSLNMDLGQSVDKEIHQNGIYFIYSFKRLQNGYIWLLKLILATWFHYSEMPCHRPLKNTGLK